ncbi:MAG: sugar ABC transporter permease [Oceanococcaceae bacterium]
MRHPALLSLPLLLGLIALIGLPALGTLALSGFIFDGLGAPQWAGLKHWQQLAADPLFRQALSNSLLIASASVALRLVLALAVAMLLSTGQALHRGALLLLLLPLAVPGLVWATAWLWLLNPHFGPVATLLDALFFRGSEWLLTAAGARSSLVLILGLLIGETVLILLIARRQIPGHCYIVARVEGMGAFGQFRRITLPLLAPVLLLLALRDFALTFQTSFLPSQIVTKGGPQFASYLLPQYVYENSFEYLRFGYAAALSSTMLLIVVGVLLMQGLLIRRAITLR